MLPSLPEARLRPRDVHLRDGNQAPKLNLVFEGVLTLVPRKRLQFVFLLGFLSESQGTELAIV